MQSFPFDGGRGFGCDIQDNAAGVGDFVNDAGGDTGDQIVGETGPVRSHEVIRGDGTEGDGIVIGALIAHDADALDAGKDGEILVYMAVKAGGSDLLAEDGIGLPDDFRFFRSYLSDNPDGEAGTGEGLAPDELPRETEGFAQGADFIFEEHAQGLDKLGKAQFLR